MTDLGDTGGESSPTCGTDPASGVEHPTAELLRRFMKGATTPRESGEVVGHLLSGCPRCLGVTRSVWRAPALRIGGERGSTSVHPGSYRSLGKAAERARSIAEELLDADRHRARSLCRELVSLPAAERLPLVCSQDRFRSFHLVRLLDREIARIRRPRPSQALGLAEVAVAVAERVDPQSFGEALVADLRAVAWGGLALCQRGCGEAGSVERSLAVAEALVRQGSGDPLERARLLLVRGLVRRDQGRYEDAQGLLRRAEISHGDLGDSHLLGVIHVERGRLNALLNRPQRAVEALGEGLRRLDRDRDPWLVFEAGLERGHLLVDAERIPDALRQVRRSRAEGERLDDPVALPEVARLEARVAAAAGRLERAEELLSTARLDCLAEEAGGSAVQATLDLATVYLAGDVDRVRQLADWADGVFPSPGMGLDDQLAVFFLGCAGDEPGEYGGLLRQVARHLEMRRLQRR